MLGRYLPGLLADPLDMSRPPSSLQARREKDPKSLDSRSVCKTTASWLGSSLRFWLMVLRTSGLQARTAMGP